ncbi:MAG: hypothetical protein AB8F94_04565 [Saprospiraceae bacterium]
MQKVLILLSLLFTVGISSKSEAQTKNFSKEFSLQSTIGFGRSFHHFAPVQMQLCAEGCPIKKQKGQFGYHINAELYRKFKPNHEYFLRNRDFKV